MTADGHAGPPRRPTTPGAAPAEGTTVVRFAAGAGGWTYAWDHRRKPHVHPLATPAGVVLTRVEPPDHPWQRGVWFVVKFVDGDNFWEEYDPAGWGVQRHDGPPVVDGDTVTGDLRWIRPDRVDGGRARAPACCATSPIDDDAYALDWDVTLTAPARCRARPLALHGHVGRLLGPGLPRPRATGTTPGWCSTTAWAATGPRRTGRAGATCPARARAARSACASSTTPANPAHPVPFYATTRAGDGYGDGWANTIYPAFLWDGPLHAGRRRPRCGSATGSSSTTACGTPTGAPTPGRSSAAQAGGEAGPDESD